MNSQQHIFALPESLQQASVLSQDWSKPIERLMADQEYEAALRSLADIIESPPPPLFQADLAFMSARQAAVRVHTNLLVHLNRIGDALASACLECQISPNMLDSIERRNFLTHLLGFPESNATSQAEQVGRSWDVPGLHVLKASLQEEVIDPIRSALLFPEYSLGGPNGILLYGPPGCGKVFIAKTIANKLGYRIVGIRPGNLASSNMRKTQFAVAKVFEESSGGHSTVLLLKDFDEMVCRRGSCTRDLAEMESFLAHLINCSQSGILVIATTSRVEEIDFGRFMPGIIDHAYHVSLPNLSERTELLEYYLPSSSVDQIDLIRLADECVGLSPAQIKLVVKQAVRAADHSTKKITYFHLSSAILRLKKNLVGRQNWFGVH